MEMAEGSTLIGNQIIQPLDDLLFQLLPEEYQCPTSPFSPGVAWGTTERRSWSLPLLHHVAVIPGGFKGRRKDLKAKSWQAVRAASGQCFSIVSVHGKRETNCRVRSH